MSPESCVCVALKRQALVNAFERGKQDMREGSRKRHILIVPDLISFFFFLISYIYSVAHLLCLYLLFNIADN